MPDAVAGSLEGRLVLIAGATSASGLAAATTLVAAGARVVAVGRDAARLEPLATAGASTEVCDLTEESEVVALAERVRTRHGRVDGLLHLVGGWRGGGGLPGQTEEDFRVLERSFTALRHASRALYDDLTTSTAARLAVVSSTAVGRPLAGGANYASVKAATETWTRAVAQGLAKDARDAGRPLHGAAVIFRVRALDGLEDALARGFADLWAAEPETINGSVVELTEQS